MSKYQKLILFFVICLFGIGVGMYWDWNTKRLNNVMSKEYCFQENVDGTLYPYECEYLND